MKPKRCLSLMLSLVMLASFVFAAEAASAPTPFLSAPNVKTVASFAVPPPKAAPTVAAPVTIKPPPVTIKPPPVTSKPAPVTPAPATSTPVSEPAGKELQVQLYVDRQEARTGDTLKFTASASGGKGQIKFALWVFRNGEKIEYFSTSNRSVWEYVALYEGTYHAQVVGKDGAGSEKYKNSPEVTVTLNEEEQRAKDSSPLGMGGGDGEDDGAWNPGGVAKVMSIGPIPDVTIVETQRLEMEIPLEPDPYFYDQDGNMSVGSYLVTEGMPPSPIASLKSYYVRKRPRLVFVYQHPTEYPLANSLMENPFTEKLPTGGSNMEGYDEWLEAQGEIRPGRTMLWSGNETERVYHITLEAVCGHGQGNSHSESAGFTLRILRDSNRNGIADIEEGLQTSDLAFRAVPDVVMVDRPPDMPVNSRFPRIIIEATHLEGPSSPIKYRAEGMPKGIHFEQLRSGDYPTYRFSGAPQEIDWQWSEAKREYPMKVFAEDGTGNKAEMTLLLTVLRHSNAYGPLDGELSIEPIPNITLLEGQEGLSPEVPVSVLTNRFETIQMRLNAQLQLFHNMDQDNLLYQPVKLADITTMALTLPYSDVTWQKGYHKETLWKIVNGLSNLSGKKWLKGLTFDTFPMELNATQGDKKAVQYFQVTVLRKGNTDQWPEGQFYFKPIADQHVFNGEPLKESLSIIAVGPERVRGPFIRLVPFLRGIKVNEQEMRVEGRPSITDWRDGETFRKHLVTISGEGGKQTNKTEEKYEIEFEQYYIGETSFYIYVYRRYSDYDRDFVQLPDQIVNDGEMITPFKPRAQDGPVPMYIKRISGCPPGVYRGYGGYYEGKVQITDWQEGEMQRSYEVIVNGAVLSGSENHFQKTRWQEMRFTITVKRVGFGGDTGQEEETGTTPGEEAGQPPALTGDTVIQMPVPPEEEAEQPPAPPEEAAEQAQDSSGDSEASPQDAAVADAQAQETGQAPQQPGQDKETPPQAEDSTIGQDGQANAVVTDEKEAPLSTPVTAEDFAPDSTRFTAAQKALPRLGILLMDDRADSLKTYQGIMTALVRAGYEPNENIVILVASAMGSTGGMVQQKAELLKKMGCGLVIAVNETMGKGAMKVLKDIPLVVAGVDDPLKAGMVDRNGKPRGLITGVINAPLFENLLSLAQKMQPEGQKAGFMYILESDPAKQRSSAIRAAGLEAVFGKMNKESSLLNSAKRLYQKVDFILLDQSLEQLRGKDDLMLMGLSSLEEGGKPVYGTTLAQVAAGCAAACIADHEAVGLEAGGLAVALLSGRDIASLPFTQLSESIIKVNRRTMDAFGLLDPFPAQEEPDFRALMAEAQE